MSVTMNGNTFATWEDVRKEMFTPEEIAESNQKMQETLSDLRAISGWL